MAARALALTSLLVAGCAGEAVDSGSLDPAAAASIRLDWSEGDQFFVAARYREGAVKGVEASVSLDDAAAGTGETFREHWTDSVVWTYKVIESGFVPDADDELHDYAVTATGGLAPLAVVKVTADPSFNADPAILAAEPTVYLVFREDTDRMVGLISFSTEAGERVERAWSAGNRSRSWSVLSQANLVKAPTYLAPWSASWLPGERRLESGRFVETVAADGDAVDVFYGDELDGGLVASRYEPGQPWPTWTVAENVESWLVEPSELEALGAAAPPSDDEDFDYRGALRSSIDIDATLRISKEDLEQAGWDAEVREQVRPWAGFWWPLKKGELVFGYRYGDTVSDRIKDEIDPIKTEMDELSEALRDLKDDDEGREEKIETYREKQQELVDSLVAFYDGLQADLDGGRLRVEDGSLVHDEGWTVEVDNLSPMDKFALVEHLAGNDYPNPWYLPAWEILNSYNPGGEGWWGHCNGWAAAAILTNEPTEARTVSVGGHDISFSTADQKGLLTESHYSTYSQFYGERYNGEDDDLTDLTPAAFQRLVSYYIKEQGVALVFDTTATEAVWNFPAWKVSTSLTETTPPVDERKVDINTAGTDRLQSLPGVTQDLAIAILVHREQAGPFQDTDGLLAVTGITPELLDGLREQVTVDPPERTFDVVATVTLTSDAVAAEHVDGDEPESFDEVWGYELVTDEDGTVLRGTWDVEDNHPDFAWVPYSNPASPMSSSSENPYLDYERLLEELGEDIERL